MYVYIFLCYRKGIYFFQTHSINAPLSCVTFHFDTSKDDQSTRDFSVSSGGIGKEQGVEMA